MNEIAIYQTPDKQTEIQVRFEEETVWLNQDQMVLLFEREQSVRSRHINSVFKDGGLDKKSNMQKMHIPLSRL